MVKPGIKKLAITRSKELNKERRSELNLMLLRQGYLTRKLLNGHLEKLSELKQVQMRITVWYERECQKIKQQARVDEISTSEKVRIYHHELHQKHIRKSSILQLEDGNDVVKGHDACAALLENAVQELLLHPV